MKHRFRFLVIGLVVALSFVLALSSATPAQKIVIPTAKTALDSCVYLEPDTLFFNFDLCDPLSHLNLDSVFFYIHDCGDTGLFWKIETDQQWAVCQPDSGFDSSPVQVTLDISLLPDIFNPPAPGDTLYFYSTVTVSFPGTNIPPKEAVVALYINCSSPVGYDLLVYPHYVEQTLPQYDSSYGFITLLEAGNQPLYVDYTHDADWVILSVEFPPLITQDSVRYEINSMGLAPGTYVDTVTFYARLEENGEPVDIEQTMIVLTVTDQSDLVVIPESFIYTVNTGDLFADSMYISTITGDTLLLNFSNTSNWLTLPLFFTAPRTPTSLWFNINTNGLAPGRYYDEITITAYSLNSEFVDEVVVPVRMMILDNGSYTIETDKDYLQFTIRNNLPTYDSIYVYEVGGANIPFMYQESVPWMIVGPALPGTSLTTPALLYIVINQGNLPPGYYTDTLEIYSTNNDTAMKRIPVDLFIQPHDTTKAFVQADPDWYNLTAIPGTIIDHIPVNIYESSGMILPYNVEIKKGEWLHWSNLLTVIPTMPDSTFFEIHVGDLAPGVYYDTAVIYKPTDDLPPYDDVYITFRLNVLPDTTEYLVDILTDPKQLYFEVNLGETVYDSLFVYESNGFPVPFIFDHIYNSNWLTIDPLGMQPYVTPASLLISVFADDSLLAGHYYTDTIEIMPYPNSDTNFASIYVPVTMLIKDPSIPTGGDSLLISTVAIPNCDRKCYKLSVFTQLEQHIKGANIPFEIPNGITICSLSTSGLYTENWDKTVITIDSHAGYFQTALVNTHGYTIPSGLTEVFDVYFKLDDCYDGRLIYWDTTFSTIPNRSLAFVDSAYNLIYPGYDKYRNPTTVSSCLPGDFDEDGYVDIGDLVNLVDFMFSLKLNGHNIYPINLNAFDLNHDCLGPDIADLVYMVDYMFLYPYLPFECGCLGDTAYMKSVNSNFALTSRVENGFTIISLNAVSDIRGVDLKLFNFNGKVIENLVGDNLDLITDNKDGQLVLGLFDMNGNNVIPSGINDLLRIEGEVTLEKAVLADDNYTTIYPALGTGSTLPNGFELSQNYPNPFNPTTEIKFSLSEAGHVLLEIYNINGQLVTTLADGQFDAGWHTIEWNSRDNNDQPVASGIYLYRLESDNHSQSKKMMLLK